MTEALQAHMDAARLKMRLLDDIFDDEARASRTPEEREQLSQLWVETVRAEQQTWEALSLQEKQQADALWDTEP